MVCKGGPPLLLLFPYMRNLFLSADAASAAILWGDAPPFLPAFFQLVLPIHKVPYRLVKTLYRLDLHIFIAVIFF